MNFTLSYEDYFNDKKERNMSNTPIDMYNCGGYALKTFNWYLPYGKYNHLDIAEALYEKGMSKEEIQDEILKEDLQTLLSDFNGKLIYISSIEEASPEDTVVAYRLYLKIFEEEDEMCENIDTDFHFRVRINNLWSEKCGEGEVKKCNFTEEPWPNTDCTYDGPILYFIFKDR